MNGVEDADPYHFAGAGNTSSEDFEKVAEEHGRGWEVVSSSAYDDCSIFPPSLHEGLHLRPDPLTDPSQIHVRQDGELESVFGESLSPPMKNEVEEAEEEWVRRGRQILEVARRWVDSALDLIGDKLGSKGTREGGAVWSLAAVAVVAAAAVYVRRRNRREKELLLSLLEEKDRRICHLMEQIALMNEIIAARHQVAVLRSK